MNIIKLIKNWCSRRHRIMEIHQLSNIGLQHLSDPSGRNLKEVESVLLRIKDNSKAEWVNSEVKDA